MRCNCENSHCRYCHGKGCRAEAGLERAMYIGPICDDCADSMPPQYMLGRPIRIEFYNHRASDVYIEEEIQLLSRGDTFMVEASDCYWTEVLDDEFYSAPIPYDALFEFKVFQYSELNQAYEIDITESMTDDENSFITTKLNEIYTSQGEAAYERRRDRD